MNKKIKFTAIFAFLAMLIVAGPIAIRSIAAAEGSTFSWSATRQKIVANQIASCYDTQTSTMFSSVSVNADAGLESNTTNEYTGLGSIFKDTRKTTPFYSPWSPSKKVAGVEKVEWFDSRNSCLEVAQKEIPDLIGSIPSDQSDNSIKYAFLNMLGYEGPEAQKGGEFAIEVWSSNCGTDGSDMERCEKEEDAFQTLVGTVYLPDKISFTERHDAGYRQLAMKRNKIVNAGANFGNSSIVGVEFDSSGTDMAIIINSESVTADGESTNCSLKIDAYNPCPKITATASSPYSKTLEIVELKEGIMVPQINQSEDTKFYYHLKVISEVPSPSEIFEDGDYIQNLFIDNFPNAKFVALANLLPNAQRNSNGTVAHELTAQEIYEYYIEYLIGSPYRSNFSECFETRPSDGANYIYVDRGWCKQLTTTNADKKVPYFDLGSAYGKQFPTKTGALPEIFQALYEVVDRNKSSITPREYDPNTGRVVPIDGEIEDDTTSSGEDDPCYASAGSTGWILCPLVKSVGDTLKSLYTDTIKGYLTIDAFLLDSGSGTDTSGSGSYQAWRRFVDIANIILVVFFLVIIFSQVTGVGIDNYGIKKALPKVIIAAVLINASFIICQLAADLSNIIGNSIEGLFSSIGDGVMSTKYPEVTATIGDGFLFRVIVDGALGTAGAVFVGSTVQKIISSEGAINTVVALIIPLLFALLVALIAVLFFFVMLGIRKAAIVVLVSISPIAFACYMLPNAKKYIFDRWFKLMKTMLIAYPLCGILVGGSGLASAILMSSGLTKNFLFFAVNMLLMVVPFFVLPSLIKSSIGIMGTLTQKASNFARGVTKKTQGRVSDSWKNSEGYKRRQAFRREETARNRANRTVKRLSGKTARTQYGQRKMDARLAEARELLAKQERIEGERQIHKGAKWSTAQSHENELALDKERFQTTDMADSTYFEAASRRQALALEKEKAETKNYASDAYFKSKQFIQEVSNDNEVGKISRYFELGADGELSGRAKSAQDALKNRLLVERDSEEWSDNIYSRPETLAAALSGNAARANAKLRENYLSQLNSGKLDLIDKDGNIQYELDDYGERKLDANGKPIPIKINQDNQESLKKAHANALRQLAKVDPNDPNFRVAFQEASALVSVLEDRMMRSDGSRTDLVDSYATVLDENKGNSQASGFVRSAVSNYMNAHGKELKGYNRGNFAFLSEVVAQGPAKLEAVLDTNKSGRYALAGLESMTVQKLNDLDDSALKNMKEGINRAIEYLDPMDESRIRTAIENYKTLGNDASDEDKRIFKAANDVKNFMHLQSIWQKDPGKHKVGVTNLLFDKIEGLGSEKAPTAVREKIKKVMPSSSSTQTSPNNPPNPNGPNGPDQGDGADSLWE